MINDTYIVNTLLFTNIVDICTGNTVDQQNFIVR